MAKKPYNGHESKTAWNVSLWINNDEGLYNQAREHMNKNPKSAARLLLRDLGGNGAKTPDGYKYSINTIRLAINDILD